MLTEGSVKAICDAKGYVLNGYVSLASPLSAELYALQGWDTVTLDMEHGSIGFDAAVSILQAVAASGAIPLARVPKGEPALIPRLLDAGVLGITAAMIQTRTEAENLVRACRYPPAGTRGLSRQTRAALVYGKRYVATANERISVFAMIETQEGMDNLEAITAVPGLDGIYFGGVDYGMSLRGGRGSAPIAEDDIQAGVELAALRIVQRCGGRSMIAGMNAGNPSAAAGLLGKGFRFITLSSDANAMITQSKAWVSEARTLFGNMARS